jgi:hypothetical protein
MNITPVNLVKQNYINHIALVLDGSYSMSRHVDQVIKVADEQIAHLARRSKELDQETRVTVYIFSDDVKCIIYDKDVLRMPSLKGLYRANGNTALVDATTLAINDLSKTPEIYGDHSFLIYVLTDGEENCSNRLNVQAISGKINALKDNWTLGVFVPNQTGKHEAKKFGFPSDNISVWDATSVGGESEAGKQIRDVTDTYMTMRSQGMRGTKNLFSMNVGAINKSVVTNTLAKLHPGQYRFADISDKVAIAPFVETLTKRAYKMGEGYYQLSKPEKIQETKSIALLDNKTKAVYVGKEARTLLNLPNYEVKVAAADHPDYTIFVQSLSVNRNLMPGTKLLLLS